MEKLLVVAVEASSLKLVKTLCLLPGGQDIGDEVAGKLFKTAVKVWQYDNTVMSMVPAFTRFGPCRIISDLVGFARLNPASPRSADAAPQVPHIAINSVRSYVLSLA